MQTSGQSADNEAVQTEKGVSYLPPTTETRKLTDEMLCAILKVAADNKLSLTELDSLLDRVSLDNIEGYRHPVTDAMHAVLKNHEDLKNIENEAFCMVRLEISHKMIAENDKTFLGKILNAIHLR